LTDTEAPVRVSGDFVLTITLNRPQTLNALDEELHRGLVAAFESAASSGARAIVLTGEGRAFSAGGDLEMIRTLQDDRQARRRVLETGRRLFGLLAAYPIPVIAAVNGPAIGAGCTLALLCDIVMMADDAILADPHVRVGLVPGDGGTVLWPLLAGLGTARALLLSGDSLSAPEAHRLGLAYRIVSSGLLMSEATAQAERIAALPRVAVRETKQTLNLHVAQASALFEYGLAAEDRSFDSLEHRQRIADLLDSKPRDEEGT
jgi:enoyl-CoA hydratase/carnithine racemase